MRQAAAAGAPFRRTSLRPPGCERPKAGPEGVRANRARSTDRRALGGAVTSDSSQSRRTRLNASVPRTESSRGSQNPRRFDYRPSGSMKSSTAAEYPWDLSVRRVASRQPDLRRDPHRTSPGTRAELADIVDLWTARSCRGSAMMQRMPGTRQGESWIRVGSGSRRSGTNAGPVLVTRQIPAPGRPAGPVAGGWCPVAGPARPSAVS